MTEPALLELINAEIDRELDAKQIAVLARGLLADPEARALRDELRRLCTALDAMADVEPPRELKKDVLAALPHPVPLPRRPWYSTPQWRYAALFAGVLAAGAVVYQTVRGPKPATAEVAGTMAARARTPVDSVRLDRGPVLGQVSLYRDSAGLILELELVASEPVDVRVGGSGHEVSMYRVSGRGAPGGSPTVVALPGFGTGGQTVNVTFLMAGREVGAATLRIPADP